MLSIPFDNLILKATIYYFGLFFGQQLGGTQNVVNTKNL